MLLDHCDNAASGGSMDNTTVLAEILRQGLDNVAFYAIYDPDAAQQAARAGVGRTVTLSLGGKIQAPALRQTCRAGGHGPRQAGVRRPVPQPRPDGARHAQLTPG